MPLGHELAGVVEWVGDKVTGATVGDRVVVHPVDEELDAWGAVPAKAVSPRCSSSARRPMMMQQYDESRST